MEIKNLTILEAAEIYGISSSTLYKLSAERKIPLLKIGRTVLIPISEFEAWLDKHRVGSGARR